MKVLSNGTVAKDNMLPGNQTKWLREKLRHRYAMSMPEESELQVEDKKERRPLKTSDVYKTKNLPARFDNPEWFEGYDTKAKNPFYATASQSYGATPPSVHTMPTAFFGKSQKFTGYHGKFGMYRNHSLNTELDKSTV